jgi:hypothetical protein
MPRVFCQIACIDLNLHFIKIIVDNFDFYLTTVTKPLVIYLFSGGGCEKSAKSAVAGGKRPSFLLFLVSVHQNFKNYAPGSLIGDEGKKRSPNKVRVHYFTLLLYKKSAIQLFAAFSVYFFHKNFRWNRLCNRIPKRVAFFLVLEWHYNH